MQGRQPLGRDTLFLTVSLQGARYNVQLFRAFDGIRLVIAKKLRRIELIRCTWRFLSFLTKSRSEEGDRSRSNDAEYPAALNERSKFHSYTCLPVLSCLR